MTSQSDLLGRHFPVTRHWGWRDYAFDDFKVRWDTACLLIHDIFHRSEEPC